ncbi:FAD-binding oxidoreductase [Desulfobulbus sp. F5]|nr:FAD-binding oxidoreductase [Desulfobulbus sp. F5]
MVLHLDTTSTIFLRMDKHTLKELRRILGPDSLLTSWEDRACYRYDASGQSFLPDAAALPETAEQVAAILRLANERRFPVIPRGGAGNGVDSGQKFDATKPSEEEGKGKSKKK